MLSGKEKRYLRAKASKQRAIIIIGKDGIGSNLVESLEQAISSHELVKCSMLNNCDENIKEVAFDLAALTNSQLVQTIGKVFVLYRRSDKNLMEM